MTAIPSGATNPNPRPATARRGFLVVLTALLAPIPFIWMGAATLVARGLQFPPSIPYSTRPPSVPVKPQPPATRGLRELLGPDAQEIALRAGDGGGLRAFLMPATGTRSAVVLVYPNQRDPRVVVSYYKVLHSAAYPVMIIDYAGAQSGRGFGWEQRRDIIDACAALHGRGVEKIGVLGVSEGAAAALFAGAQGAPVAAIIADSSYADLRILLERIPPLDSLNPLFDKTVLWELGLMLGRSIKEIAPATAAAKLDRRSLLVIDGADDPLTPPADAKRIFAAAQGPRELWIVPGVGHAGAMTADPARYAQRVGAFLARYLGTPKQAVNLR
jgi:pimeloyl-ACP methyl ester carboxylesterase